MLVNGFCSGLLWTASQAKSLFVQQLTPEQVILHDSGVSSGSLLQTLKVTNPTVNLDNFNINIIKIIIKNILNLFSKAPSNLKSLWDLQPKMPNCTF